MKKRGILRWVGLCAVLSAVGTYSDNIFGVECAAFLQKYGRGVAADSKAVPLKDASLDAALEEHSLAELVEFDSAKNLAVQHPWMVMNAAQRQLHLFFREGVSEVPDPHAGRGMVRRYNFFSSGGASTNGRLVINQLRAIDKIVGKVVEQALGKRSGRNPICIDGVPGTGKSEMMAVIQAGNMNATLNVPEAFVYEYEWKGLEKIPALHVLPEVAQSEGQTRVPDGLHDSPLVLLPEPYQRAVIEAARDRVKSLINMPPMPEILEPSPQAKFIRDSIIQFYQNKEGHPLSLQEIVDRLNDHVVIRRRVFTTASIPIVAKQPKDVDWEGLFVTKNPGVAMLYGAKHPLAYIYALIPGANGAVLLFDEILKNEPAYQASLLNLMQSRTITYGGAPETRFDAVVFTATNTEDIQKLLEKEKKPPMLDRLVRVSMNHALLPSDVARTLIYEDPMMRAKKLRDPDAPELVINKGNLDLVIPDPKPLERLVWSDGRYNLWTEGVDGIKGIKKIHISPQALRFISYVVVLSRMKFESPLKSDEEKKKYPFLDSVIFTDEIARLRAITGDAAVQKAQLAALWSVSIKNEEGTFGIGARAANTWLQASVDEAARSEEGDCVNVQLLIRVLKDMIREGHIGENNEQRGRIIHYANLVAKEFIIDELQDAVLDAFNARDGSVERIYDEVIEEILAMKRDANAAVFTPKRSNQPRRIDRQRLGEIRQYYVRRAGRELDFAEIALFQMENSRVQGDAQTIERNPDLMRAISRWHAAAVAKSHGSSLERLVEISAARQRGHMAEKMEEAELVNDVFRRMEEDLGYCPRCIQEALQLAREQPSVPADSGQNQ